MMANVQPASYMAAKWADFAPLPQPLITRPNGPLLALPSRAKIHVAAFLPW